MNKVHDISSRYKKRIMQTDNCAGCSKKIEESYTEVVMPGEDNTCTHIALCDGCYKVSQDEGIF